MPLNLSKVCDLHGISDQAVWRKSGSFHFCFLGILSCLVKSLAMLLDGPYGKGDNLRLYAGEPRNPANADNMWTHLSPSSQLLAIQLSLWTTDGVKTCDQRWRGYCSRSSPNRHLPWTRPGSCTWGSVSPFAKTHSVAPSPGAGLGRRSHRR